MAAVFNALFILILCGLAFAVYAVIAFPLAYASLSKFKGGWSRLRRVLVGFSVIACGFVLIIFASYMCATSPNAVFRMAFGFLPTADVRIESARHFVLGDTGEQSIVFCADTETIDRILAKTFETSLAKSAPNQHGSYTFKRTFSESFASEIEELHYEPTTRRAQYRWFGID